MSPLQSFNNYFLVMLNGNKHMVSVKTLFFDAGIFLNLSPTLQVPDRYVNEGFQGGQTVAEHLRLDVKQYLSNEGVFVPWDAEILIYTWCDAERLTEEYLSSGVIASHERFLHFRTGFNFSPELTTFWDIRASDRNKVNCEYGLQWFRTPLMAGNRLFSGCSAES